jgi:hypothetical protein
VRAALPVSEGAGARKLREMVFVAARLDLDDVGAEISKHYGAEGAGNEMREVDDTQFGQRRFGENIAHLVDPFQNGSITRLRAARGVGCGRV